MTVISTLAIDLAKNSFELCGLDVAGKQVVCREVKRDALASYIQKLSPCLIVMEACASSCYWARLFRSFGHEVKLIAPQKVVGFRKYNKNDKNDAYAIAVASNCPGMEFVAVKSVAQQDIQSVLRIRSRLVQRQTALINEMRGLLGEYGVAVPEGTAFIRSTLAEIAHIPDTESSKITPVMRRCVQSANEELNDITRRIELHEKIIVELTKSDDRCQRLQSIPGVGPLTAATVVSSMVDPNLYKNGRQYAASIGLTPRHVQSGGKDSKPVQLGISKHGDGVLRSLLVQGGMTVAGACKIRARKKQSSKEKLEEGLSHRDPQGTISQRERSTVHPNAGRKKQKAPKKVLSSTREDWILRLITEKGMQKTAVAIANRNARIIHSILKNGGSYHPEEWSRDDKTQVVA